MTGLIQRISRPPLRRLLFLFIVTIAILIGIFFWDQSTNGRPLDFIASVSGVQKRLQAMGSTDKAIHFLLTLTLDTLLPLAYGSFLAGVALEAFGENRKWLSIPAFLAIPIDLSENVIQLFALRGYQALLPVKAVLTPVKFILIFAIAVPIAIVGLWLIYKRPHRK